MYIFLVFLALPVVLALLTYPLWKHTILTARARRAAQEKSERLMIELSPAYQKKLEADRAYALAQEKLELERRRVTIDEFKSNLIGAGITIFGIPPETRFYTTPARPLANQNVIDADQQQLAMPVLPFRDLLASGLVQTALAQGKMILGYANGILRYGTWLDLYSCGIGGVSGSGKSTTVRFLLFQGILAGARLIMVDPHIGDPDESLAAQFTRFSSVHIFPPCDDTVQDVLHRVRWLMQEYQARKHAGRKTPFLILVVDEVNAVMRNEEVKKELAALLVAIAQEGRKFGLFAMLLGQRWSEGDLGGKNYGAVIRSSLASLLAHRFTDEEQAKKLVGSRNGARCLELSQGHYLFRDTGGDLSEMITPYTTSEDGAAIEQLLPPGDEDIMPVSHSLVPMRPVTPIYGEMVKQVNAPVARRETGELSPIYSETGETALVVSQEDETAILRAAYELQRDTGRVLRSEIRDRLNWNNKRWPIIKTVCDKHGIV